MKTYKGIPDNFVFGNLNIMEKEHKTILLTHLKELMIDIRDDRKDISDCMESLKGILVSLNNLKKHYGN